jgi:hypothetical protein
MCKSCNKSFLYLSSYKKHLQQFHGGASPLPSLPDTYRLGADGFRPVLPSHSAASPRNEPERERRPEADLELELHLHLQPPTKTRATRATSEPALGQQPTGPAAVPSPALAPISATQSTQQMQPLLLPDPPYMVGCDGGLSTLLQVALLSPGQGVGVSLPYDQRVLPLPRPLTAVTTFPLAL